MEFAVSIPRFDNTLSKFFSHQILGSEEVEGEEQLAPENSAFDGFGLAGKKFLELEYFSLSYLPQQQTYLNVFQQMVSNLYTKILHCYFYDIFNRVKNYVRFAK